MKFGKHAMTVLEKRYLSRDEYGNPAETAEELFTRVAKAVAAADLLYDKTTAVEAVAAEFYHMMTELEFLPNSPTLMNAGRALGQLSACFVLPVGDSMEEIFEAIKQAALIHKSGGGTGFSFSQLRPKGSMVKSTGGVASGPVSFMKVFNMATEAVKQGGTRRGANMGLLRVDHPDIMEFITCKSDKTELTNFNISVGITEAFMQAVEQDDTFNLVDPSTHKVVATQNARDVFAQIVRHAWNNGEPGIVFLDRINRDNAVPSQGEFESTNPCGEQPLLPYEACNLGSINLLAVLTQTSAQKWDIDYKKLEQIINKAVHFLDNVIDINQYPSDKIDFVSKQTRKIGLGVMGFADMLLRLQIPYDSDDGVALGKKLMAFINEKGHEASQRLANLRGAFPLFHESTYAGGPPLRNATVTTIAPTGTLSILAGCSSGIEPVFAFAYTRQIMDETALPETNAILHNVLKERGLYSETLLRRIAAEGTLTYIADLPEDIRRIFVCAHDISPVYHIKMQAAFQESTDNAVSKTVNFKNSATISEIEEAYKLAYQLGCKGTTIYRDGSRAGQTLKVGAPAPIRPGTPPTSATKPRPRPEIMSGVTKRVKTGCGNLYITVNYDDIGICEVFTSTGKAGGCASQSEATSRLVSLALRSGIDIDDVIRQIRGIRCPSTVRQTGIQCTSCPDAIAQVIKETSAYLNAGLLMAFSPGQTPPFHFCPSQPISEEGALHGYCCNLPLPSPARSLELFSLCPECSKPLEHEGGCVLCQNCGYSKCN